jgi:hypothetical protein
MPSIELERTLVKSPPELWDEISSQPGLSRWLGTVSVSASEPPRRLEWDSEIATGVIELEAAGWGTKIVARATSTTEPASDRSDRRESPQIEDCLRRLLDDLGSSSLTSG